MILLHNSQVNFRLQWSLLCRTQVLYSNAIFIQTNGRERQAYEHLKAIRSSHNGQLFIRKSLHSYQVVRLDGSHHVCLVHPPLHMTLWHLQCLGRKRSGLSEDMVTGALRSLLKALGFSTWKRISQTTVIVPHSKLAGKESIFVLNISFCLRHRS